MEAQKKESTPADTFTGTVIDGRYLIEKKIGEGGIGAVYLALDKKMLNRQVVVKVLLQNWLKDVEIRRKFEHEKEALSRLDHPGIVSILDSGMVADDNPYFVMPFIPGKTLEEIIKESGVPTFEFCADVIDSLSDALSVAHSSGVLHRDIKPENIIISVQPDKRIRVRLIDFGIARVMDSQVSPVTHVERSIGTVWYVAPEQLLGHVQQTPSADIFSLAVVAYVMLTGRRPFDPQSIVEMAILHKDGLKLLPSAVYAEISPKVDTIISHALAYKPEERYQDVREFGTELAAELRRLSRPVPPSSSIDNTVALPSSQSISSLTALPPIQIPSEPFDRSNGAVSVETRLSESIQRRGLVQKAFDKRGVLILIAIAGVLALGSALISSNLLRPAAVEVAPSEPVVSAIPAVPLPNINLLFEVKAKNDAVPREENASAIQRTVFENGDSIRINITSSKSGYLYLINEDFISAEKVVFTILFPTISQQGGFAQVDANSEIKTSFIKLHGDPGQEIVWVVWTAKSIPAFEEARINSLKNEDVVKDKRMADELKKVLERHSNDNLKIEPLEQNRTVLTGTEDMLIYRMEFEHR